MIAAETFCDALRDHGVGLVTGVPCGWFQGPLALLSARPGAYLPAANEGSALAIAAGAELGGVRSAVLLQNSGLGNLVNPLTSLIDTYEIPVLVLMTLRGWPDADDDEPQHALTGRSTQPMLDLLGVGHRVLGPEPADLDEALTAADHARAARRPYFVLVPRGVIGRVDVRAEPVGIDAFDRLRAIEALLPWLVGCAVVATTGRISRELHARADADTHFYMLGSMGHALGLGLGLAAASPARPVVVVDGDGALLMHLGATVAVGAAAPVNLVHVVLDNAAYDSTGGQPAPAPDWSALGRAAGYRSVHRADSPDRTATAMSAARASDGPHLIVLAICRSGRTPAGHPLDRRSAGALATRFHDALTGDADTLPTTHDWR